MRDRKAILIVAGILLAALGALLGLGGQQPGSAPAKASPAETGLAAGAKRSIAIFPFEMKPTVDARAWAAFEEDVRTSIAGAPVDRFTIMPPEEQAKLVSSADPTGKMTLATCPGPFMGGICGALLKVDEIVWGLVFQDGSQSVAILQAQSITESREIFTEIFEGASLQEVRDAFRARSGQLVSLLSVPPPVASKAPSKASSGRGHALRMADPSSAALAACDESLMNAIGERGLFVRMSVLHGMDLATLTRDADSQRKAAEKLEPCGASFGPMYHVDPLLKAGEQVTRKALLVKPSLNAEQCADLRDRIAEMHDQAKEAAPPRQEKEKAKEFMNMATLQLYTAELRNCP
jgi:hypothetical protein